MYAIGQKFEGTYPPEAAQWCNENGAVMVLGDTGFEIQAVPTPTPTEAPPIIITSDNITVLDADALCHAMSAGEKTAAWLIAKLEL